ncbi:AAEL017473-PA [Aedes aegypti]|uniref:AAEL017473-PA n=1 Tax=Aedes aegypti TaxID=7159 RepID=J9HGW9_AEDAE|nr:AAEL017473-PA [Aedes aegypti]
MGVRGSATGSTNYVSPTSPPLGGCWWAFYVIPFIESILDHRQM